MTASTENPTKLTGKKLIEFARQGANLSKNELARQAGYMRTNRNDEVVPDPDGLYDALLEAHGTPISSDRAARSPAYETAVHSNGSMFIGPNYVKEAGVGPYDKFGIEVMPGEGIFLRLTERVEGSPREIVKPAPKAQKPAEGGEASGAAASTEAA